MLSPPDVQGLLSFLTEGPPELRVEAAAALAGLPLDDDAWQLLTAWALPLLDQVPRGSEERLALIRILVRMPLENTRARLRGFSDDDVDAPYVKSLLSEPEPSTSVSDEELAAIVEQLDAHLLATGAPLEEVLRQAGGTGVYRRLASSLTATRSLDEQQQILHLIEAASNVPFIKAEPLPVLWSEPPAPSAPPPVGSGPRLGGPPLGGPPQAESSPPARWRPRISGRKRGGRSGADPAPDQRVVHLDSAQSNRAATPSHDARFAALRTAWPRLSCASAVTVGVAFPVEVGLRPDQDRSVEGTKALSVPAEPFKLDVELVLDGFAVIGDRTFSLEARPDDPFPFTSVPLVAIDDPALAEQRRIGVTFWIQGEMRGYAARNVVVTTPGRRVVPTIEPAEPAASDVSAFNPDTAADLTIVIQRGDDIARTTLLWSFGSHRVAMERAETAPKSDLGDRPEAFLSGIVKTATSAPNPLNLLTWLEGTGREHIASKVPPPVREAIRRVTEAVEPHAPTILLVTEDPYVPWELAVLEPGPVEAGSSPFLGARAAIGRWTLSPTQPPPLRPPLRVEVESSTVITGEYTGVPGWKRLENAESEAAVLLGILPGAQAVNAEFSKVLACLEGDPPADILHFALHGQFDDTGSQDGLVLIQHPPGKPDQNMPEYLKPPHVSAGRLPRTPLVFLNACQVGAGNRVLGDYSGMAKSFVFAGAAGVVAPLWSVDDRAAHDVALDFYTRALGEEGAAPAEVLRSQRAEVTREGVLAGRPTASLTCLAYQFFGHPKLELSRRDRSARSPTGNGRDCNGADTLA